MDGASDDVVGDIKLDHLIKCGLQVSFKWLQSNDCSCAGGFHPR